MDRFEFGCRRRLSPGDVHFIVSTLASKPADEEALLRLLADPEVADRLLDHPRLLFRVFDEAGHLRISEHLFFYLLVRTAFRDAGMVDPDHADYVAGVLAEFVHENFNANGRIVSRAGVPFGVDLIEEMVGSASRYERFFACVRVGNLLLALTGLFHEHLAARQERTGAPGLDYYEGIGMNAFRDAGDHPLAREFLLEERFAALSQGFRKSRRALNGISSQFLCLN